MNQKRRERIRYAAKLLDEAGGIIDRCKDEEEDSMYNLEGTSLENTDMYAKIEGSYDCLDDASSDIESAREKLFEAIG